MKIVLIRRRFSAVGGGELYLQRLIEALLMRGHSLHLLSESWTPSKDLKANIQHHVVPRARSRNLRALHFAQAADHALRSIKVDCVFSMERTFRQDIYRAGDGVHATWLERQKVFAPFWKKPFCGLSAHHRNVLALEKQTFNPVRTRYVIANSNMVRNEIISHFPFPPERIRVIPNGVDLKRFQITNRILSRARFNLQPQDFVLLFAGSGWERKGLVYSKRLLHDLRKLASTFPPPFRSVKLLVVGKGRPPIFGHPDTIYCGPIEDIENAYAASDLMVFLPIYEPAANVVSEALASGLPVITSAFNGASEWIHHGQNGHVFASPSLHKEITQAALEWMRRNIRIQFDKNALSMDRNVEATLEVISQAAADKA